jgi:CHASE2 domain-containing sensor protein
MTYLMRHPIHLLGIVAALLFAGFALIGVDSVDMLDLKVYDMLMRLRSDSGSPSDIVLVEIDDDSIEKLGLWPWSRSVLAKGIRAIQSGRPRLIGLNIIFSDPEITAGLDILKEVETQFRQTLLDSSSEKSMAFLQTLSTAQTSLDYDRDLAESIQASNRVVLSMYFKDSTQKESSQATGSLQAEQNPFLTANAIQNIQNPDSLDYPRATEIILPIPALLNVAKGIGHINMTFDKDGKVRRERLLYEYGGLFYPSYTIRLAAVYLNVNINFWTTRAVIGSTLRLGQLEIPMTPYSEMLVSFKGERGSFKSCSFYDALNSKNPMSLFQNKLVLIHVTATGIMKHLSTPVDAMMPAGEFTAHSLWSVHYAHQKGVIHRDIKPANVMLLKNDTVKITDFGIARINAASQTQTGVVKGTPSYMSPEQFSGKKVDGRSDIFSLGAMIFQLLTGELPFVGDSLPALMHHIMNEPHANPKTINPRIPEALVLIVNKALEKDVEKRYQRAGQMSDHLRKLNEMIDTAIERTHGITGQVRIK